MVRMLVIAFISAFVFLVVDAQNMPVPANMGPMFTPVGQQGQQGTQTVQVPAGNFLTQLGFAQQSTYVTGLCTFGCPTVVNVATVAPTVRPTAPPQPTVPTTTAATTARPATVIPYNFSYSQCILCNYVQTGSLVINQQPQVVSTLPPLTIPTTARPTTTTTTTTTARPATLPGVGVVYLNGFQLLRLKLAQSAYNVGNVLSG